MRILAEQGGLVIAEDGPRILVIDRGAGAAQVLAFVLLILTVVFGGFGIVSTVLALRDSQSNPPLVVAAVVLAAGIATAAALLFVVRSLRRIRSAPLDTFTPVAVLDRQRRIFLDGAGQIVAPLEHVRFERRMQMTSSSPKLVAVTPAGIRVLKRGNPFGGGIGDMDAVLSTAILRPPG
ncbi:hypothetical protein [Mycobacterium adipatum]|uniref:hypothetical protein n=1 Tax=Mycobacterium adipatum TaxID=1682113 RepID=UPI000ADA5ACF|nr:hypothetical protein [Mycobacterium adipatum]